VIKFKKKIINEKESTSFHPLIEFITLKNPGDKGLKWKIDYQSSSTATPTNTLYPNGTSIKSFNSINPSVQTLSTKNNNMNAEKFCF
jgi:hypothetical protein